jgi:hypothetical protein
MITYGQGIRWGDTYYAVEGYETHEEAVKAVLQIVEPKGWTNPKWYQFWRWNDTRLTTNNPDRKGL